MKGNKPMPLPEAILRLRILKTNADSAVEAGRAQGKDTWEEEHIRDALNTVLQTIGKSSAVNTDNCQKKKISTAFKKVIALDFDGTLFENKYPDIGEPIWYVIEEAKAEQRAGADLVLWTTREGKQLEDALKACVRVGLAFVAVNSNAPVLKEHFGNDPRKIGATEYWDDCAVNPLDNKWRKLKHYVLEGVAAGLARKAQLEPGSCFGGMLIAFGNVFDEMEELEGAKKNDY